MNKGELVSAVKEDLGIASTYQADKVVSSVIRHMEAGIVEDGELALVGFGTFSVVDRAARVGHNPQTGESVSIPAKKAVKFKPSKAWTERVN